MTPDVVVDIGNSRMKWGLVEDGRIADVANLNFDRESWVRQGLAWDLDQGDCWFIASVNRPVFDRLKKTVGDATHIESYRQIPLELDIDTPESVGLDRVLACLAAKKYAQVREPFLVVQAGTALVINLVNAAGAFAGGAILPGSALMAKSLREHTAQLPEVVIDKPVAPVPGRTTRDAIRTGIYWASIGAILTLRTGFCDSEVLPVFLTGGDAELLLGSIPEPVRHIPDLVLEGILLAAEARP